MHLGRKIIYECLQSQSVFYQVLNAAGDIVFKRTCLMKKQYFIWKGYWNWKGFAITSERIGTSSCQVHR